MLKSFVEEEWRKKSFLFSDVFPISDLIELIRWARSFRWTIVEEEETRICACFPIDVEIMFSQCAKKRRSIMIIHFPNASSFALFLSHSVSLVFRVEYTWRWMCRNNYFSWLHFFSLHTHYPLLHFYPEKKWRMREQNCLSALWKAMTREYLVFMFVT